MAAPMRLQLAGRPSHSVSPAHHSFAGFKSRKRAKTERGRLLPVDNLIIV